MSLRERYERELERNGYVRDAAQERVITHLEAVIAALAAAPAHDRWAHLRKRLPWGRPSRPVRGLYLWGGVGRGKTWLMDLACVSLPFADKLRIHFHRFMHGVHAELATLRGRSDPLERVAARLAQRTRVLCFDELYVSDITDAMILGALFDGLFRRGVTLIATSNTPPDRLYEGGLQRQRFLPAIDLLKEHMDVLQVEGSVDYRLRSLERAEIYHHPLDEAADRNLARCFEALAPDAAVRGARIEIAGRTLRAHACADGIVWFDFEELCLGPRSQTDYIEIAREYQTVLLSGLRALGPDAEDAARRLIALVDELYDHNVKLIVSAAVPLAELYAGERLAFEFRRTYSRLREMQSQDYLARPHVP